MASIARRPDRGNRWQARYRDAGGTEHARLFDRKVDAQRWIDEVTTSVATGTYVDPKTARTTVDEWCDAWLEGYGTRRASSVRQAKVHVAQIKTAFGKMPLSAVRPSHVKAWTAKLRADGKSASYVYALHGRLSQIMGDAVHDGIIPRSPCSRRTSPGPGAPRPFVATTEQVWALHDAMPKHLRAAVLLGAFVGLRTAEACGLRVADVDFMRGIVAPAVQWPGVELKTDTSRTPVPIPNDLALTFASHVERWPGETLLTNEIGQPLPPWALERSMRTARTKVDGLPEGFRFHDLRHYLASLLISAGCDVKVVQARLRHASAKTTLDTYGHLWPDSDDRTRSAIAAVLDARQETLTTSVGQGALT